MVMFSPADLERLLDTPVCRKHAKHFRRVTFQLTCIITLGALAALAVMAINIRNHSQADAQQLDSTIIMIFGRMVFASLSLIGLFLSTRSLEWFSSPRGFDRDRQDRAISLSCYACAPILIVTIIGAGAALAAFQILAHENMRAPIRVVNLAWWAVFLVWWPAATRAIHFATGRNSQRTTIAALLLPLIWFGQQLMVAIIPLTIVQWVLMIWSLS